VEGRRVISAVGARCVCFLVETVPTQRHAGSLQSPLRRPRAGFFERVAGKAGPELGVWSL
jgi:hypothetical protein